MQGEVKWCLLVFRGETSEKDDMQDLGVDGRITIFYFQKWDWIDLTQAKGKWQTLANAVKNLGSYVTQEIYWLMKELLSYQEGLFSMQLVEGFAYCKTYTCQY
jgi:hypothetical protein